MIIYRFTLSLHSISIDPSSWVLFLSLFTAFLAKYSVHIKLDTFGHIFAMLLFYNKIC